MAFFSNGQRESSHSGDSSSSDADSEEQRFYAKANRSQRQQSSSTSASSSGSEDQVVSTRPAAEKPAAPPSPKKNPNSSDKSAVRNQSIPSAANPNNPSASKLKKAAAAKRTKDDGFAENRSQLHQSSSISASSSDSGHEEASKRPEAEKPAAPPSPKKNPNSSDRFTVRNRSTLSEPNPNALSTSKPEKAAATKRAKDDDFAEEQPEPKKKSVSKAKKPAEDVAKDDDLAGEQPELKKKSVSKGKNAAVEVVVKGDDAAEEHTEPKKKSVSKGKKPAEEEVPASNPTRKKPRKQQQESPAAVPIVTPEKDSPQKSSKKAAHMWTDHDESVIMHGYLVCAKEGLELPKNMPHLLEKINDSLAHEATKPQLYEKLRRMKARYESIKNKMDQGNIKEDLFAYKNPHEKELYKLWKQAWGEQHEEDEMEVDHTEAVGDDTHRPGEDHNTAGEDQTSAGDRGEEDEEEELEDENDGGTESDKERKTPSTEKPSVSNHTPSRAPVSNQIPANDPVSNHFPVKTPVLSTAMPNNKREDRVHYETIMKETGDMLAEVTRDVKKMAEKSEVELKALLDSHLSSANGVRGTGGAAGGRINSAAWVRNRDPGLDGIYDLRELPPLDGARARILEGKLREVEILETQARLRRYALLREECSAHLESMKASGGNSRS